MLERRSAKNDRLILEGIVTTVAENGDPHISPMGPDVDRQQTSLILKPFTSSTTYLNLMRNRIGVFHVVDDSLMLAAAVTRQWPSPPPTKFDEANQSYILLDACRAYRFEVEDMELIEPRVTLSCRIVERIPLRDAFGWNRAHHAILELAIHATRLHILEPDFLAAEIERLQPLVDKTGGHRERQAWQILNDFIETSK